MPSPIFMSRPPVGFSALAVLRGLQLTVLGASRALQNPNLARKKYLKQAAFAIAGSIAIQLLVYLPPLLLQFVAWISTLTASATVTAYIESNYDTLLFFENHVFTLGYFMVSAMSYFRSGMDELFLTSIQYFDNVYKQEHPKSSKQYYPTLQNYHGIDVQSRITEPSLLAQIKGIYRNDRAFGKFLYRYARRSGFTLLVYALSGLPSVGPAVIPIVAFYSFNQVAGTPVALALFITGCTVKAQYMMVFLSTFWGGRSLVRELLSPYFLRVPFSRLDKDHWFRAREGILFGFGCGFYLLLQVPFMGLVVYATSQASMAYLITKVSEPPPSPGPQMFKWVENEVVWTAQDRFLSGVTLNNDGFGHAIPILP